MEEINKTLNRIREFQDQVRKSNDEFLKLQRQYIQSLKDHSATMDSFREMIDQYKELQKVCVLQDKKISLLEQQIVDMIKNEKEFVFNNLYQNRIN